MYNLKKHFIFLGEKFEKKKLGLPRLLYLDYDYFRNLISLISSITITSENHVVLDYSITITSENYVVLDYSITITSENYVALDYSITITSKKSSQPIWPSLYLVFCWEDYPFQTQINVATQLSG